MSLDNLEKKLYGLGHNEEDNKEVSKEEPLVEQPQGSMGQADQTLSASSEQTNLSEPGSAWQTDELPSTVGVQKFMDRTGKIAKAIFWIMMLAVIAAGGFLYYYVSNYLASKDFVFDINAPEEVMVAQPFEITIELENKSKTAFRDPQVMIQLPEGIMSLEKGAKKQVIEDTLENMSPGTMLERKYKMIALQDPQTTKNIRILFSYLPENINTRFEKEKEIDLSLEDAITDLNISAPQKVFSGEIFEIAVKYKNASNADIQNASLKLIYPQGFSPKEFILQSGNSSASSTPTNGNNIWSLPVLPPGKEETLLIRGALAGFDESNFEIKSQIILPINGEDFAVSEKSANLSIAASPLSLSIVANGNRDYIAIPGDIISYSLRYKNNTDVGLADVIIKAQLKGEMFDFFRVQTLGSFNSISNSVTWNASNIPQLKNLEPGAEGEVSLGVGVKSAYPIKRQFDKNFTLKINAEINSPTVPHNISSDRTIGQAALTTKTIGDYEVDVSSIKNIGPYPPRVNRKTTYTIYIKAKNYATDLSNFKFVGLLSPDSKWIGNIKTNSGIDPQFNDRTGEIVWEIPTVAATKGIISSPLELSFQIENTPSSTNLGQDLELISNMIVSATDVFTGKGITKNIESLRTDAAVEQ